MIRSIILLALGGTLLLMAVRNLRTQRLKEQYALLFLFTGAPFLILAVWPNGVVVLADLLKIEKPTLMVLAMGGFIILILFEMLTIISIQDRKITSLAQIVGILQERHKSTDPPSSKGTDADRD